MMVKKKRIVFGVEDFNRIGFGVRRRGCRAHLQI